MYKSISLFLAGALTAFLVFFKMKSPDVVNVQGDQVNDPKIKDNSKHKLSRSEKRKARLEKRKLRKSK